MLRKIEFFLGDCNFGENCERKSNLERIKRVCIHEWSS